MGATESKFRLSALSQKSLAEKSNMSLDELQDGIKEFLKKYPSGYIDKKGFKEYTGILLPTKTSDEIRYTKESRQKNKTEY